MALPVFPEATFIERGAAQHNEEHLTWSKTEASKLFAEIDSLATACPPGWDRKVEVRLLCLLGQGDVKRGRKALATLVRAMHGQEGK